MSHAAVRRGAAVSFGLRAEEEEEELALLRAEAM
jgi:hypothetical protein